MGGKNILPIKQQKFFQLFTIIFVIYGLAQVQLSKTEPGSRRKHDGPITSALIDI